MLKLYGSARSRASRTLWMLAECGVPFEQEDFSKLEGEAKTAILARVNPLGKGFTVADLNLASCFTMINAMKLDMSPFPNVQRWLAACHARPGYARYRAAPPPR